MSVATSAPGKISAHRIPGAVVLQSLESDDLGYREKIALVAGIHSKTIKIIYGHVTSERGGRQNAARTGKAVRNKTASNHGAYCGTGD